MSTKRLNSSLCKREQMTLNGISRMDIDCSDGRLWVTCGIGGDIFVDKGAKTSIKAKGNIVIEGVENSKFSLAWR